MKVNVEKLGFVRASKYRRIILLALHNTDKTPTQLSQELSLISEQVSRALKELLECELVLCLNPRARKGRIYSLTPQGRAIASKLLKE